MSHCHSEHTGSSHSHTHSHSDSHTHDHSDDITPALQHSLYTQINFPEVTTLNETTPSSGLSILKKPWTARLDNLPELVSLSDAQLLLYVPFTSLVKLHSILIRSSDSPAAPKTLKVFVNKDANFDFASVEDLRGGRTDGATQVFELARSEEVQVFNVRRAVFGGVRSLSLFFESNFGDQGGGVRGSGGHAGSDGDSDSDGEGEEERTRISYLGFRGEWMQVGRAPENILYEAVANPKDHAMKGVGVNQVGSGLGGK